MLVFGFAIALTASAAILAAGFMLEQGWLTGIGLLAVAAATVAGIVMATNPAHQARVPSPTPATSPSRVTLPPRFPISRPSEGAMLAVGFGLAITAAAGLLSAGFSLEQGWLTGIGLLAVAAVTVAGIVKASNPTG